MSKKSIGKIKRFYVNFLEKPPNPNHRVCFRYTQGITHMCRNKPIYNNGVRIRVIQLGEFSAQDFQSHIISLKCIISLNDGLQIPVISQSFQEKKHRMVDLEERKQFNAPIKCGSILRLDPK